MSTSSKPKSARARTPKKEQHHKQHAEHEPIARRDEKENPFAFKIISETVTKELLELEIDDMERRMAEEMKLANHGTDLGEASLLDFYTGILWWAKEEGLDAVRASAVFTAAYTLLENIREKRLSCADNIRELSSMLTGAGSASSSPGGLDILSLEQGKQVVSYLHKVLFQHYRLYQFVFTHMQAEEVIGLDLHVELPKAADIPWPPPLTEGIPMAIYDSHIKTPPPSPTPEEEAEATAAEREAQEAELIQREAKLLTDMTQEQVQVVVDMVTKEIFHGLEDEVTFKLREKENTILTRLNKIHKVAE